MKTHSFSSNRVPQNISGMAIRGAGTEDIGRLAEVLAESFHPPVGLMYWAYPFLKLGIYEDLRLRLQAGSPHYLCLAAIIPYPTSFAATYPAENHPVLAAAPISGSLNTSVVVAGTIEIALRSSGIGGGVQYPYISNLAVGQCYRRRGIARKLLLSCEPTALEWGFRDIYLHVLESNEPAQQLYLTSGYQLHRIESGVGNWLLNRPRRLLLHKHLK
ncbi:GNAT family N-acetyltransferase [Lusitaniella coriacea]